MVMLCSLYGGAFVELFDNEHLMARLQSVLRRAASSTRTRARRCRPRQTNYSTRVHVDCPRLIPGYITNMGATILLDDFTARERRYDVFLPGSLSAPSRRAWRSSSATLSR